MKLSIKTTFVQMIVLVSILKPHNIWALNAQFQLDDNSVTAQKLSTQNINPSSILEFDGTSWGPSPIVQPVSFKGMWDPTTDTPAIINHPNAYDPGEFFIVSSTATINGVLYTEGDWLLSNNLQWDLITVSSDTVGSFKGRRGPVLPTALDYTWAQIDKSLSSLLDIADIDPSLIQDASILVWSNASQKWVGRSISVVEADPTAKAFAKTPLPNCSVGQILTSNGNSLSCVTDNTGSAPFSGTANTSVMTDGTGSLAVSTPTTTEVEYLVGATSNIQNQINGIESGISTGVLNTVLANLNTSTNQAISTNDTVLSGFGKLQAQIDAIIVLLGGSTSGYMHKGGDTLIGNNVFDFSGGAFLLSADPVNPNDIVNLNYLNLNYGVWTDVSGHIFRIPGVVNIGNNIFDNSALLKLDSTTQGVLYPRMTTAERDAIQTPAAGLIIFNTLTSNLNYFDGASWVVPSILGASLTTLNGITNSNQSFATGSVGTNFNIASAGSTHTFNIPTASSSVRGALSASDFTAFNNKQSSTLPSANLFIGNASNLASAQGITGDITLANTGITTIANNAINNAKINDLAFSKITGKPTTLAGYGITNSVSSAVTSVATGTGLSGGTITSTGTIDLGTELAAINAFTTTGLIKKNGSGSYSAGNSLDMAVNFTGILPLAKGGTNGSTLDGAGIVTKTGAQTISAKKTFSTTVNLMNQSDIRFFNSGSTKYISVKSPATSTSNYTLTFPNSVSTSAGKALTTDGIGTLSWTTPSTSVTSLNGMTGDVIFNSTTNLPQGTNLYFTESQVRNTVIGELTNTTGTVSATTILSSALKYIQDAITSSSGSVYLSKSGNTVNTGTFAFNPSSLLQSPTPINLTDVANMSYTTNALSWSKSGLNIYRNSNIGIKQSVPGSALDLKGTMRLSGSTSGFVQFQAPAAAGSTSYTLPTTDGTSGQFLTTNGAGTLSWASYILPPQYWTLSSPNLYYTTGAVGIGTTAPTSNLNVVSGTTTAITALSNSMSLVSGSIGISQNLITTTNTSALNLMVNNSVNPMTITSSGNVGINNSAPTNTLDVVGGTASSGAGTNIILTGQSAAAGNFNGGGIYFDSGFLAGSTTRKVPLQIGVPNYVTGGVSLSGTFFANGGYAIGPSRIGYGDSSSYVYAITSGTGLGSLVFGTSNVDSLFVAPNGQVAIGKITPSYPLDVVGDIYSSTCVRAASFTGGTCSSDARLKDYVTDYSTGLESLLDISPMLYQFNGLGDMPNTGETTVGVIADDVPEEFQGTKELRLHPNDVELTTIKTVNYSKFIYVVINAIKEMYSEYLSNKKIHARELMKIEATKYRLLAMKNNNLKKQNELKQRLINIEKKLE